MTKALAAALAASTFLLPVPALAQADELATLRARIAELESELGTLATRLDQIEQADAAATAAPAPAPVAAAAPASPPPVQVAWRGAPEFTGEGGWSFKPRGRVQIDAGTTSTPDGITDASTGFGSEIRRAYLGVEGRMPGGIGYRAEVELANSAVEITDLYLTYQASSAIGVTIGQTKPFWGLEEVTSDLFTSFVERGAFNSAFGHERRLGASAQFTQGPVIVQAGVFTDNVGDLNNDENNSLSFDGRAVFSPKLGDTQLHLGGSIHLRNFNSAATSTRYRARPFIHTPDIRFIDTGNIAASGEDGYGLELAVIHGPFHATGEWRWQQVDATALASNPGFSGGYAEIGYFLTRGDTRGYRGGVFDRTRPAHALGAGGIGAVQLNLRYDRLDLVSGSISGGTQNGYLASLVWVPTAYTKLMLNYGHLDYGLAAIPAAGGDRDYSVDSLGLRAQIDF